MTMRLPNLLVVKRLRLKRENTRSGEALSPLPPVYVRNGESADRESRYSSGFTQILRFTFTTCEDGAVTAENRRKSRGGCMLRHA